MTGFIRRYDSFLEVLYVPSFKLNLTVPFLNVNMFSLLLALNNGASIKSVLTFSTNNSFKDPLSLLNNFLA